MKLQNTWVYQGRRYRGCLMAKLVSVHQLHLALESIGWRNAEFWMRVQASYDLAQEKLRRDKESKSLHSPPQEHLEAR